MSVLTLLDPAFVAQSQGQSGGDTDPNFANVALLLHMDGTNGSTTFTDSSNNNYTIAADGNAQITTTDPKFGTGAGLFDGSGDRLVVSEDFSQSGDFTIELFFKAVDVSGATAQVLFAVGNESSGRVQLSVDSSQLAFALFGTGDLLSGGSLSSDTWHYVAVKRDGSTLSLWLDGVQVDSATRTGTLGNSVQFTIGDRPSTGRELNGRIDELRFTNGVARDVSVVPTAPFPDSGPGLWTPAEITTAFWFDADDAATITETSGSLDQINDKSGNGNHATATSTTRPSTGLSTLNGKNLLDFNQDFLTLNNQAAVRYVFFVVTGLDGSTNISDAIPITGENKTSSPTQYIFLRDATDYDVSLDGAGSANTGKASVDGNSTVSGTNINLGLGSFSTSDVHIFYVEGDNNFLVDFIGRQIPGSTDDRAVMKLGEIFGGASPLSSADIDRGFGYLAHEWGLTANLPSGHPYKSSAPTIGESTLLNGLIAWWSLDETSGNRADSHTGNYTLTENGTVGSTTGKVGNAVDFTGNDSNFLSTLNAAFNFQNSTFYFAGWIRITSDSSQTVYGIWNPADTQRSYAVQYSSSANELRLQISSDGGPSDATIAFSASINTRYFVEFYHDADNDEIGGALNGGSFTTAAHTTGAFAAADDFVIGRSSGSITQSAFAEVDELAVWNRMLTSSERTELYNSGNGIAYPSSSTYDPDAQVYIGRFTGTYSTAELDAINTFFVGLKNDSLFNTIDFLYIFALDNAADAVLNIKGTSFTATNNGMTFTARQGFTGNGSSAYLSTGYNPSSAAGRALAQDSVTIGGYVRNNPASPDFGALLGGTDAFANGLYFAPREISTGSMVSRTNSGTTTKSAASSVTTSAGWSATTRLSSSTVNFYRNGTALGSVAATSNAPPNEDLVIGALANNGSIGSYSSHQIACVHAGSGWDETQCNNFSGHLETLLDALGAGVVP